MSNPGHCLYSGIVDEDKALPLAKRLLAPDIVLGLGRPHDEPVGGLLQPDELPQRLGVAARQRVDRGRA